MTLSRLVPLHIHGALEAVLAMLVMAAPFVFGFEAAAMVTSVVIGALMLSVAFATHATDESILPISTHAALDGAFAFVMAVAAVVFAASAEVAATAILAGGGVALILLTSLTRYSPGRA